VGIICQHPPVAKPVGLLNHAAPQRKYPHYIAPQQKISYAAPVQIKTD